MRRGGVGDKLGADKDLVFDLHTIPPKQLKTAFCQVYGKQKAYFLISNLEKTTIIWMMMTLTMKTGSVVTS